MSYSYQSQYDCLGRHKIPLAKEQSEGRLQVTETTRTTVEDFGLSLYTSLERAAWKATTSFSIPR